jgi:UDP-N-acetylmuramate--alanine ligase
MGFRKIWVVFQPHRYTRTKALAADFPPAFAGAEKVWLLPVYAASEPPLAGGTSEDLARTWRKTPGAPEVALADKAKAAEEAAHATNPGDVLLLVGAGDLIALAPAVAAVWRA